MAEDFNPQLIERPLSYRMTGGQAGGVFHPAVGSKIAVVYIECTTGNAAAVNAKLAEVDALATQFVKKTWTPAALDGCMAEVEVQASARHNVPVE